MTIKKRTATRMASVQAVYQGDHSALPADQVVSEFLTHRTAQDEESLPQGDIDSIFFSDLVKNVAAQKEQLDAMIEDSLAENWRLHRLDQVALAMLRCGVCELLSHPETPAKVIINEYMDVAHSFLDDDQPGFINKILDKLAKILRPSEF